jgi:hypothetical protein
VAQVPSFDTCGRFSSSYGFQSGSYSDSGGTSSNSWTSSSGSGFQCGSGFHTHFAGRNYSWNGGSSSGYSDGGSSGGAPSTNDEGRSKFKSQCCGDEDQGKEKEERGKTSGNFGSNSSNSNNFHSGNFNSSNFRSSNFESGNFNSGNFNFKPKSYADAVPPHVKERWREGLLRQNSSEGVVKCIATGVVGTVLANVTSVGVTLAVSQSGGIALCMSLTSPWGWGCLGVAALASVAVAAFDGYTSKSKRDKKGYKWGARKEGASSKEGASTEEGETTGEGESTEDAKSPAS